MHFNVTYNLPGLLTNNLGDNDAESVFKTGLSVCAGFANLFKKILKVYCGLECKKISGEAKGLEVANSKNDNSHAWNAIKIEGDWYLVDSTWGSGHSDSNNNYVR